MSRSAPRLLRGIRWVSRTAYAAPRALEAVAHGVVLGLSSEATLAALDVAYYGAEDMYVDVEYNRRGLWSWEQAEVDAHFPPGGRVVVSAAGGGREVHALLQQGFDARGFECNRQLVHHADALLTAAGHGGRMACAPRNGWPSADGVTYDALVVGWGSYTLMSSRAQRVAFLREAAVRLRPGAPVLLSFFPRRGRGRYFRIVATIGTGLRRLRGAPPVEIGDALVPNFAHHFTRHELTDELETAGFRLVTYEWSGYGRAVAYLDHPPTTMSMEIGDGRGQAVAAR